MKTIKVKEWEEIPKNYTGIAQTENGTIYYLKNRRYHRRDGPAIEFPDGEKWWLQEGKYHRLDGPAIEDSCEPEWWVEENYYSQISLKDYVVLDYYQGKFGLMWYKLLGKDEIIVYPDIPGLITKE